MKKGLAYSANPYIFNSVSKPATIPKKTHLPAFPSKNYYFNKTCPIPLTREKKLK